MAAEHDLLLSRPCVGWRPSSPVAKFRGPVRCGLQVPAEWWTWRGGLCSDPTIVSGVLYGADGAPLSDGTVEVALVRPADPKSGVIATKAFANTVPMGNPTTVARNSKVVWLGGFSIAGVGLDARQENGNTEKIEFCLTRTSGPPGCAEATTSRCTPTG